MALLSELGNRIAYIFPEREERPLGDWAELSYPRLLPIMRMQVQSWKLKGFGCMMKMETSMLGMMKLSTFSFTPAEGTSVPFLLTDTMSMGRKRLAYVEFYDCRKEKSSLPALEELEEKYRHTPNYEEKPAWYVRERMKGSLIKCAPPEREEELAEMVLDAVSRYRSCMLQAEKDPENLPQLKAIADRMLREGNPSSKTLNTVLGEDKAAEFFRQVVLPVQAEKGWIL